MNNLVQSLLYIINLMFFMHDIQQACDTVTFIFLLFAIIIIMKVKLFNGNYN